MQNTISVIHDDCRNALNHIPPQSIHCAFYDPPYNTKNKKNKAAKYDKNKDFERKNWQSFYAEWDDVQNYVEWAREWIKVTGKLLAPNGTVFICGSFHCIPDIALALRAEGFYTIQWVQWLIPNAFPNLSMTKMVNANQTIIWARKGDRHYYDKEAAKRYNNDKNLRDYWIINNDTTAGKRWKHPSKKPIDVVYRALDIALPKRDDIAVLDMFGGSGTTGAAFQKLTAHYGISGKCYLFDTSAEYCTMMRERLINATDAG